MREQTWLVAKNTYFNRLKGFGFWAMVISPFLIAALYLGMIFFISSSYMQDSNIAVIDNPALTKVLNQSEELGVNLLDLSSVEAAKSEMADEKIDGYLLVEDGKYVLTGASGSDLENSSSDFIRVLSQLELQGKAVELGLSESDLALLLSPVDFSFVESESEGSGSNVGNEQRASNSIIATITTLMIFMMLMVYTSMVAEEVANEKSNRIMEILLAATSSNVQYYGKILGVILLTFTQMLIYVLGFGIAYPFVKNMDTVKSALSFMSGINLNFAIYLALISFFGILGYLFLTSIIASLVNDHSQVQQAVQPITYFAMIGYIAGVVGAAAPEALLLRVLSFVPFISPTLMSGRYAIEYSTTTEAYIALFLQILATFVVAKIGERIYARNVLSYSDDKILRQFFNNLRGKELTKGK